MTTPYRRTAICKKCGTQIPLEDAIGQWIRNHPRLDSSVGFAFMDKDVVAHQFKSSYGRDYQCVMFVEFKSRGKQLANPS